MPHIVIKLSGSYINPSQPPAVIESFAKVIKEVKAMGFNVGVVVGGGAIARSYISHVKHLGASQAICDYIGILVSRLNAHLLIAALKEEAYPLPPTSLEEALSALLSGRIVVMGGLQPGQSTNAVAAILAELTRAPTLINVTTVDGVYDADPAKKPNAKRFKKLQYNEFAEILFARSEEAGRYELFDRVALNIVLRSKIAVHIISGNPPENIIRVLKGEDIGTLISE